MACRRPSSSTGAGGFAPGTSARSRTRSSGCTSSGCSRSRRDEDATRRRHRARPRGAPQRRRAGARARGVRVPGPRGRRRAPLRRLPEPLGGRLSLGDGASDARDRPRAARGRREPGGGGPVLRRSVRRVDPPLAATTRVQPPRVVRAARGRRRRPGDRGRARPAVDATARVGGDDTVPRSRDARADPARDGGRAVTGILVAALVLGVPALAFALWPLLGARGRSQVLLRLPPDRRGELAERKAATLRALRELSFEHDAGHIGDADYAELSARYEGEAAAVLTELDRLGPAAPAPSRPPTGVAESRSAWRHPAALATGAILLVLFGIAIGAGVVRYTEPDRPAAAPRVGAAPLAPPVPTPGGGGPPGAGRAVTPEVLQGMLRAARASLFEGRYGEAIAAYQAVLKRDPKNVDALTHLGLIVALGGHADTALETLDRALAIDPNYPPALLYRGQVLYESKQDTAGAIRAWEKFLAVAPPGEDRARVEKLIADAKARR